jgi:hypothetical protein
MSSDPCWRWTLGRGGCRNRVKGLSRGRNRTGNVENIIALLLIAGALAALFFIPDQIKRLKGKTLTLAEYLIVHPQCKTKHDIRCAVCGSSSIKN